MKNSKNILVRAVLVLFLAGILNLNVVLPYALAQEAPQEVTEGEEGEGDDEQTDEESDEEEEGNGNNANSNNNGHGTQEDECNENNPGNGDQCEGEEGEGEGEEPELAPLAIEDVEEDDEEEDEPALCEFDLAENGNVETTDESIGLIDDVTLETLVDGDWDVFDSIPGWYTDYGTAGIEVHRGNVVVPAYEGSFIIELDSHANETNSASSNSAMSQDLTLAEGDYNISFAYRARTSAAGDNTINIYFDDVLIETVDGTDTSQWVVYDVDVEDVSAGEHKLTFQAAGIENSMGGLLDAISISRYMEDESDDCSNETEEEEEEPEVDHEYEAMCSLYGGATLEIRFQDATTNSHQVMSPDGTEYLAEDGVVTIPLSSEDRSYIADSGDYRDFVVANYDGLMIYRHGDGTFTLIQGAHSEEEGRTKVHAFITISDGELLSFEENLYKIDANDELKILNPNNTAEWNMRTGGGRDAAKFTFTSDCIPEEPTAPENAVCSLEDFPMYLEFRFFGETSYEEVTTETATYDDESDGLIDGIIRVPLTDELGDYITDSDFPEEFSSLALQRHREGSFSLMQGAQDDNSLEEIEAFVSLSFGEFHQVKPDETNKLEGETSNYPDTVELENSSSVYWHTYTTTGLDQVNFIYVNDCFSEQEAPESSACYGETGHTLTLEFRFFGDTNVPHSVVSATQEYKDFDGSSYDGVVEVKLTDELGEWILDESMPEAADYAGLAIQRNGDGTFHLQQGPQEVLANGSTRDWVEAYITLADGTFLTLEEDTEGSTKFETTNYIDEAFIQESTNTIYWHTSATTAFDQATITVEENFCAVDDEEDDDSEDDTEDDSDDNDDDDDSNDGNDDGDTEGNTGGNGGNGGNSGTSNPGGGDNNNDDDDDEDNNDGGGEVLGEQITNDGGNGDGSEENNEGDNNGGSTPPTFFISQQIPTGGGSVDPEGDDEPEEEIKTDLEGEVLGEQITNDDNGDWWEQGGQYKWLWIVLVLFILWLLWKRRKKKKDKRPSTFN
jgi:hypothetical protein